MGEDRAADVMHMESVVHGRPNVCPADGIATPDTEISLLVGLMQVNDCKTDAVSSDGTNNGKRGLDHRSPAIPSDVPD